MDEFKLIIMLKELLKEANEIGKSIEAKNQRIKELEAQVEEMAKNNKSIGTTLALEKLLTKTLEVEIKELEGWMRRHFIATCPDAYCNKECNTCPKVDKWLKQALKGE